MDDAIDALSKVADICRKKNINSILAIWDIPGHLSATTAFNIVEYSKKFNWDRHFKLAVVYTSNQRFTEALFIETVASNRGYVVKMFENEQEAKSWLLGSYRKADI